MEGYKKFRDVEIGDYIYLFRQQYFNPLEKPILLKRDCFRKIKITGKHISGDKVTLFTTGYYSLIESILVSCNKSYDFLKHEGIKESPNYVYDLWYCTCDLTCLNKVIKGIFEERTLKLTSCIKGLSDEIDILHYNQKRLNEDSLKLIIDEFKEQTT